MSGERVDATDGAAAAAIADGDGEGDCDLDLSLCCQPLLPAPLLAPPMPPAPPPPRCGVLAPLPVTEGDDDADEVESARPRLGLDLAR